ncbi:MAG TPA: response regulator [bacterium]|nr:response regulator [bacterium]
MEQKRIAIVDDDTTYRRMLRKTLETAGYRVSEAKNALEVYGLGAYDLMLLDIRMPGIDGHKVLTSLKEDKGASPVIVITGLSDPEEMKHAFTEGADAFMLKPVDAEDLLAKITELLARPSAS